MKRSSGLLPLGLGLALGACATLTLRPLLTPVRSSTGSAAPQRVGTTPPPPAPAWPARLAASEAEVALDAYLALAPLSADAPEAAIAERAVRLRSLLTLIPAEHIARLLSATADRPGEPEARIRRLAFTAWTELDAPAAARWAAALGEDSGVDAESRARLTSEAALAWARDDFAAAYAWAAAHPAPAVSVALRTDLLAALATTAPERALSLARDGGLDLFTAASNRIFDAWLDLDPAAAFAALGPEVFSEQSPRRRWLPLALARWAARDMDSAFAWFDAQGLGRTHKESGLLISLVRTLATQEPPPDFARLAALLKTRAEHGLGRDELGHLLREWMPRDSAAASAWLDQLPDATLRAEVLKTASFAAGADPDQAIAFARRLPEGPDREKTIADILSFWSERDPAAALAWLDSPDAADLAASPAAQAALVGALAQTDPSAALARWNTLESEAARRAASSALARAWARAEPDAATAWLFAQIPEGPHPDDRAAFAALSPEENIAAGQRFEKHFQQLIAFKETSSAWIAQDPESYLAWAENLPSATQRQTALYSLAWSEQPSASANQPAPGTRLALLSSIKDQAARDAMMRAYLAKWLETDQPAARRWVTTHAAQNLLPAPKPSFFDQLRALTSP